MNFGPFFDMDMQDFDKLIRANRASDSRRLAEFVNFTSVPRPRFSPIAVQLQFGAATPHFGAWRPSEIAANCTKLRLIAVNSLLYAREPLRPRASCGQKHLDLKHL